MYLPVNGLGKSHESHEQRNLVGHGPWGHKESDMTKATAHVRARTHTHTHTHTATVIIRGENTCRPCGMVPDPS